MVLYLMLNKSIELAIPKRLS